MADSAGFMPQPVWCTSRRSYWVLLDLLGLVTDIFSGLFCELSYCWSLYFYQKLQPYTLNNKTTTWHKGNFYFHIWAYISFTLSYYKMTMPNHFLYLYYRSPVMITLLNYSACFTFKFVKLLSLKQGFSSFQPWMLKNK